MRQVRERNLINMKKIKENDINVSANADAEGAVAKKERKSFPLFKVLMALVLVTVLFYFGFTCEVREGSCAVILRFGEETDPLCPGQPAAGCLRF